jgi:hypothetical protein
MSTKPAWPAILWAVRAARAVLRTTDPSGLAPGARRLAAREFAYALLRADARTRQLALVGLAVCAAKNEPLADARVVQRAWQDFVGIRHRPAPRPHCPTRGARLPVEDARAMPLERVLMHLGFDLKRRGRELFTRCPFHDDEHPSLRANVEKDLWFCDVCGIGGDAITFVERLLGVEFADAVAEVARC